MQNQTIESRPEPPAPHRAAQGFSDHFALAFTKLLRLIADTFFAKRYGSRAIVLETVAAVPGMVGATITHLTCLRRMVDDQGWIRTLMEEAENERMHLMTFVAIAKPTWFERMVVMLASPSAPSRLRPIRHMPRTSGTMPENGYRALSYRLCLMLPTSKGVHKI